MKSAQNTVLRLPDKTDEVSSRHGFEVADETDEVSSRHGFEVADETDEVSNYTHGKATLTWFEEISEEYYFLKMTVCLNME